MTAPNTLQGLQTVLDRAIAERDEATANLYLCLENSRRLLSQRDQLTTYRDEYQQRWTLQFRQAAAIEVVQSYQSFMTRLEQALTQLHLQAEAADVQSQQARALLLERETRVASVRKLMSRRVAEHERHEAARDQRHTDEAAAIAAWHSTPAMAIPASH